MLESDVIFEFANELDQSPTVESFYLINAGYVKISNITNYRTLHSSTFGVYIMFYVHEGNMIINDGYTSSTINSGDIYLLSPGSKYNYTMQKQLLNEHYYFYFSGNSVSQILKDLNLSPSEAIHIGKQEHIFEIYQSIKCNFRFNKFKYNIINSNNVLNLLIQASKIRNNIILKDESVIAPAIQYIRANYMKNINIDSLAQMCFKSKFYFIKLFKNNTGCTPLEYIINERITQAKYLLTTTEMSVNQISEIVGFNDPYHFSNIFYKKMGYRPFQFRKLNK